MYSKDMEKSTKNRNKVISICNEIYGEFCGDWIYASDTPDTVRKKIEERLNDPHIDIDLYIYITEYHADKPGSAYTIIKLM